MAFVQSPGSSWKEPSTAACSHLGWAAAACLQCDAKSCLCMENLGNVKNVGYLNWGDLQAFSAGMLTSIVIENSSCNATVLLQRLM